MKGLADSREIRLRKSDCDEHVDRHLSRCRRYLSSSTSDYERHGPQKPRNFGSPPRQGWNDCARTLADLLWQRSRSRSVEFARSTTWCSARAGFIQQSWGMHPKNKIQVHLLRRPRNWRRGSPPRHTSVDRIAFTGRPPPPNPKASTPTPSSAPTQTPRHRTGHRARARRAPPMLCGRLGRDGRARAHAARGWSHAPPDNTANAGNISRARARMCIDYCRAAFAPTRGCQLSSRTAGHRAAKMMAVMGGERGGGPGQRWPRI